ncbi:hypothetical protein BJ508DRAFT_312749 [Ascobolus immersus RN42]|uniref:Uncharacterized protein n=1 Tax=Ascobolus immersus RN42 TaxID=1160509 RepID=A0A3N4HRB7_ASCIM|nr:hypothetical protein BJ508DRAFT_312749 [Ascobolus immersus RN42]
MYDMYHPLKGSAVEKEKKIHGQLQQEPRASNSKHDQRYIHPKIKSSEPVTINEGEHMRRKSMIQRKLDKTTSTISLKNGDNKSRKNGQLNGGKPDDSVTLFFSLQIYRKALKTGRTNVSERLRWRFQRRQLRIQNLTFWRLRNPQEKWGCREVLANK